MSAEGPERDPRALRATVLPLATRGRPVGGGQGPTSEWRDRAAAPWAPSGSVPSPLYTPEQQAQIDDLFEKALLGELPRRRSLKVNEPERLNERHLGMVSMRASGLSQRLIAKAYGDSDTYVHLVLNHPDAVFLLSRLIGLRAANGTQYQERMERLAEPAMTAIEDALLDDDPEVVKIALKKAPLAFRVLEQGGKIKKPSQEVDHQHTHRLDASPQQISALREALIESRELRDVRYETLEISTNTSVRSVSAQDLGEVDAADTQPGSAGEVAAAGSAPNATSYGSDLAGGAASPNVAQAYLVEDDE